MVSPLFEPFTLGSMSTRNRLWVPPMCQYSVTEGDGLATAYHVGHYSALARGGAGAVIVEMTDIEPQGRISPNCLGLWSDQHTEAFKPVVQAIQAAGAKAGIQIGHAGRKASTAGEIATRGGHKGTLSPQEGGWQTLAPSAIAYPGYDQPQALSLEKIEELVEAFGAAAERALAAGFDFIEIHGAHGYLLTQFLSPLSNERTDDYGGSLENRARFIRRVVRLMRSRIPETMPLLVRLSASEFVEGGITPEETVQVVQWLKEDGLDMADVSAGGNYPAKIRVFAGYQTPLAHQIRQQAEIPVAAVGMINSPRLAEYIVGSGQADIVLVGREALRRPSFALEWAQELKEDIDYYPAQYQRAWNTRR
ncbi:NADH:flavin oxidoreductase/NADH oxidase [Rothia sp. P5764]|uniref:NADH:flavin oxidoreductase/NADH oxidase n=1 Tax=Rothia sp. P5764 TaxID=3402654 RepID=UPI003ACA7420